MNACDPCLARAQLLALLAPCIELVTTRKAGTRAAELLALDDADLAAAVAPTKSGRLLAEARRLRPGELRDQMASLGGWTCCRHDGAYPTWLTDSAEAPRALLGRGDARLLRELERDAAVTVVGSRRASGYGLGVARELAAMLAKAGMTVISGMALGIDSAAHKGALDAGSRTVAVLGAGVDVAYPPRHKRLHERIGEHGLLLSELPPGTEPWKWTFPARNRVMAALAGMTVVVEAAERSGSLITAEMASDLGRLVGAVPGPATSWLSAGANQLLHDGAVVVRDAQDVLDATLGPGAEQVVRHGPALEPGLALVLAEAGTDAQTCDEIATASRVPAADTAVALVRLELLGYLRSDSEGRYRATLLEPPS